MPRDIEASDKNEMELYDPIAQEKVTLYYKTPTNSQRVRFDNDCTTGKGKKTKLQLAYAHLKYGGEVLTGIKEGHFTKGGEVISSDPASDNFDPEWKDLFVRNAGDLVQILGRQLFQGTAMAKELEQEEEAAAETTVPGLEDLKEEETQDAKEAEEEKDPLA